MKKLISPRTIESYIRECVPRKRPEILQDVDEWTNEAQRATPQSHGRKFAVRGLLTVTLIFALLTTTSAFAQTLKVKDITSKLVCQCGCDNMLVSDCQCKSAAKMKQFVKEKIDSGATEDEIFNELVETYGESILAEPRKTGFNLLAWIIPIVAIALAGGVIAYLIRRWVKTSKKKELAVNETEAHAYRKKLEKDLEEWE